MRGEPPDAKLPSPWKDFLEEIDKALEKPLQIHCIGGFALVFITEFRPQPGISTTTQPYLPMSIWNKWLATIQRYI